MVTAKKESYGKYKEKESKTATENQPNHYNISQLLVLMDMYILHFIIMAVPPQYAHRS